MARTTDPDIVRSAAEDQSLERSLAYGSTLESPVPRISWRAHLDAVVESYVGVRGLSPQQRKVLVLYLEGTNDKEIADRCGCSEATVYKHWHRLALKAGGFHKCDVITDFHGFLAGKATRDNASSPRG